MEPLEKARVAMTAERLEKKGNVGNYMRQAGEVPMRVLLIPAAVSIFIVSASLCVAWSKELIAFIPDAKTAAAVAEAIIKGQIGEEKYEGLIGSHRLIVHSDGDVWTCYFYPKDAMKHVDRGTPVVEISKVDGRVIRFSYSK